MKAEVVVLHLLSFAVLSLCQTTVNPVQLSDEEVLAELTSHLRTVEPVPRQDEDEDEDGPKKNHFPGVASIILGVATGDLRRVFEDGIFSFLGKNAQTQAFAIFHNLLGRTTKPPTTTTKKTSTTTTETTSTGYPTRKPTIKYHRVTRIPGSGKQKPVTGSSLGRGKTSTSQATKSTVTTTEQTTTTEEDPDEEGEEFLVSRFEQALLLHLPTNPDDVVKVDLPEFVTQSPGNNSSRIS